MVDLTVPYRRPDGALLTLRDEVYAVYGRPVRAAEFVTGYKAPGNFTGHNADANGIVHAVDLFTDDSGNIPQPQGRALAEQLRQIGAATGRFSYLIHDMGEVDVEPMIAGQFNGWAWQPYTGSSAHSDHIHVSICDLYWGDPAPVGPDVYDSTAPWNLGTVIPASGSTTPIQEDDMGTLEAITPEAMDNLATMVHGAVKAQLEPVVRSVAFQEQFSVRMLEQIAAQTGAKIDIEAIKAAAREGAKEGLAAGVTVDATVKVANHG
jgi:hypothetical protein